MTSQSTTTAALLAEHAALVAAYESVDADHPDASVQQRAGIRAGISRKLTREIELSLELAGETSYVPFESKRPTTARHTRSDAALRERLTALETLAADSTRRPAVIAVAQAEAEKIRKTLAARTEPTPTPDPTPTKPAAKSKTTTAKSTAKVAKPPLKRSPKKVAGSVATEATFA